MPVIHLLANANASREAQETLLATITKLVAELVKVPPQHVHVVISDGRLLSYGGDAKSPAVYVTVKSSASQIPPITRQALVQKMVPALQETYPGLLEDRVSTFFEELPVEQIAVGTKIMVFRPHANSGEYADSPRVSVDVARGPGPFGAALG